MNQQSATIKSRDLFRKQIRKKQLQKRFDQHRKQFKVDQRKSQQDQFFRIYPQITDENYGQHISFILDYVCNDSYNFMLLSLMGYTYEDLLKDPQRQENYLILQVMTQFEEIDLPQTEEFVFVLLQSMQRRWKVILNIIVNLLQNRKYSQILRDILLQTDYLNVYQHVLAKLLQNDVDHSNVKILVYQHFCICCQFIKSHPHLQPNLFLSIAQSLANNVNSEEQKYMLFQTLSSVSISFMPSFDLAQILYKLFRNIIFSDYFNFVEEITQFLIFYKRSKCPIQPILLKLLVQSLQNPNQYVRNKVLIILQLQICQEEGLQRTYLYQEMKQLKLIQKIRNLYFGSNFQTKKQCLLCLQLFASCISLDQTNLEPSDCLLLIISESLENYDSYLLEKSLNILFIVVKTVHEEQLLHSQIFSSIANSNFHSKLISINQPNEAISKIIEQILLIIHICKQRQ